MEIRKFIKRNYGITFALTFAVSIFMFTGCSTPKEATDETMAPVQESTSQPSTNTSPLDHNVDLDTAPLTDCDKVLSLKGYGAKGASDDKDLTIIDMLMYGEMYVWRRVSEHQI